MTDPHVDQLRHKHYQMVWDTLRELGIECVLVEFTGLGDDAQIIDCYPESNIGSAVFGTKTLTVDTGQSPILLRHLIIELSDEIIRNNEIPDWLRYDRGYGILEWIVAHTDKAGTPHTDRISVTVNVAVINTSNFEYDGYGNRAGAV